MTKAIVRGDELPDVVEANTSSRAVSVLFQHVEDLILCIQNVKLAFGKLMESDESLMVRNGTASEVF